MNTTSSSVSPALVAVPAQLNIWFGSFLWVAGNIGCIGNMIVFSSRTFRQRAYAVYLISEAISDLIYFDFLLLTRILQNGFQIAITSRYDVICRLRQFDSVWNHLVSLSMFSFATIDRILSLQRSNTFRQWSNRVGLAYKMCIASVLFWLLFFGHRLILYSVNNGKCVPLAGFYASFDSYIEACITAMGTPIVMSILGFFLLRSVRSVLQGKTVSNSTKPPVATKQQSSLQQMDSRLTIMLLLQLGIAILTRIPYAGQVIYSNITQSWSKSPSYIAIENIIIEFIRLLAYTFFTFSFYISFISNSSFRRKFKSFFQDSPSYHSTTQ